MKLEKKVRIDGTLRFISALHIGSGNEGVSLSNMGVLLDPTGKPILPGSTLKGKFRTSSEKMAHVIGLTSCMMDRSISGVDCITDEDYRRQTIEAFRTLTDSLAKLAWIKEHTCHICRLFGSPLQAGRIFFNDGELIDDSWAGVIQTRDGVVIDRDSERARDKGKYDFDVVPAGVTFKIGIELINPIVTDLAQCGAVLHEWQDGSALGGFTSRGLGRFIMEDITVKQLDFQDPPRRVEVLLGKGWQNVGLALLDEALQTSAAVA